ncbi:MAG: 1,4-alpha-glucan branching protein GlgB [Xanthomonadales bacterium]|nr:1,4-alpha-glucan branching protein GlgB [Gammaproteobacteria bacterium]NNL04222.1 1,4-alpha-glucan branching protein GlgB [Xanthomonadales bacterium]
MKSSKNSFTLTADSGHVNDLAAGRHGDPFSVLGRHAVEGGEVIRCFQPRTLNLWIEDESRPMDRLAGTDLFEYRTKPGEVPSHYRVIREMDSGIKYDRHDPYAFWPQLDIGEMAEFNFGRHRHAQNVLGAKWHEVDGVRGTLFSVWAPNAGRVSVVGDFNDWDGRFHPMRFHADQGIWELFIPDIDQGHYRFEIVNAKSGELLTKSDPFARASEFRPGTASVITGPPGHTWLDDAWQRAKSAGGWHKRPMSVYEVHAGSWRRNEDGSFMGYRRMAEELCAYVKHLGFTHIELLPITEHPLDESWGYQATGYFSPTSRFGSPDDFRYFVDHFHRNGIGVILDWVPAHFPRDGHALANFDGTALFEYHEPLKAGHPDWGTLVFNFERNEVISFLVSNAIYWLQEFHLDGLRVDAVASMLYLSFSRKEGQWLPNRYGGNENLEAVDFLRAFNEAVGYECPGCVTMAEESSAWPGVTQPTSSGGLGFGLKWNMGWMNDTLEYFEREPIHRKYHHDLLTFGPMYAFDENFMLPLSHDEVVHLKKSLFSKMPGDEWQKFANLRLLLSYQWTYPGKQLLFMGGEFAQTTEWNCKTALPWERSREKMPEGITRLVGDLNHLQAAHPALYEWDVDGRGFEWLNGEDSAQSVIAYLRRSESEALVVVLNFTPIPRYGYRIPMAEEGAYWELFNSDGGAFGGSDMLNRDQLHTEHHGMNGRPCSLVLDIPPLSCVILRKA